MTKQCVGMLYSLVQRIWTLVLSFMLLMLPFQSFSVDITNTVQGCNTVKIWTLVLLLYIYVPDAKSSIDIYDIYTSDAQACGFDDLSPQK